MGTHDGAVAHTTNDDEPLRQAAAGSLADQRWRGLLTPKALPAPTEPEDIWVEETIGPVPKETSDPTSPSADTPQLAGRIVEFGREHVLVVVVALVVGVVFAVVTYLHARPDSLPVVPVSSLAGEATPPVASESAVTPVKQIKVHVLGAVVHPGVVSVPEGSRVQDVVAAAGGMTADADPADLNLAAFVTDGSQIVIGTTKHPAGQVNDGSGSGGVGGSGGGACVNLNTASDAQLQTLPGVGPVTAQKIIAWRAQHGHFSSVTELQEVDGIGPKTVAQLAAHVCL